MSSMTLKAARANIGLTLIEAAKKLGINKDTLSRWERGESFPNVPQIKKIEETYHVDFNSINFLLPANSVKPSDCEE